MATLAYIIEVEGLSDDAFVVTKFDGQESLSASMFGQRPCYGFCYQIELASRLPNLTPEQVVDRAVELRMYRNRILVQRVHGVVRAFTQGDIGHHHTFYSLTLVPALERLSLRHNSRIFQHQTTSDIIATLLQEMAINDYAFSLARELAQREFCVQYRESDLDFLHRLAAEEGMIYSFIHEAGKHTLVFSDSSALLPSLAEPVPYNGQAGGVSDVPYIKGFRYQSEAHVAEVELKDYSFKKPAYSFSQSAQGAEIDYQQPTYTHFDAPGRYKDDLNGTAFTRTRLNYLRRDAQLADGKSNEFLIRAGYKFTLSDHLNRAFNRDWLLVRVSHHGEQPQALEEKSGHGATTYNNQWQAIPGHINWQATPEIKPIIDGPMIATVVGPKDEEIFCDEHGRVKVHFHWDRHDNSPEHSSCWVRVSQGWAGSQYGMMAIPRIGHEVIVSFLNGDPDQPIITGRTYHITNTPPYSLPENKTKTVLRSETHQGEGFNELSFEDQAEQEQIYLHAQKDFDSLILNDMTTHVKHDQHSTVDSNHFTQTKRNHHFTVGGESRTLVKQDVTSIVEGSLHQNIAQLHALKIGNELHIKAGKKIVIEAGSEMTLKVNGSFIKLDSSGVSLVGSKINLNSGGSPGLGSGYSEKNVLPPNELDATASNLPPPNQHKNEDIAENTIGPVIAEPRTLGGSSKGNEESIGNKGLSSPTKEMESSEAQKGEQRVVLQAGSTPEVAKTVQHLAAKHPGSTIVKLNHDGSLPDVKLDTTGKPLKVLVVGHGDTKDGSPSSTIGGLNAEQVSALTQSIANKTGNESPERVSLVGCNTCNLAKEVSEQLPNSKVTGQDRIVKVNDNGRKESSDITDPKALPNGAEGGRESWYGKTHELYIKNIKNLPDIQPSKINAKGINVPERNSRFQTLISSSKKGRAIHIKLLKQKITNWGTRSQEIMYNELDSVELPDETRSALGRALSRNQAYTETMKKILDNPDVYEEKFFSETHLLGNDNKPLTILMSNENDGNMHLELSISEPDNLVGSYTKKPGTIKGAGAQNRIRRISDFKRKMTGTSKFSKSKIMSNPESEVAQRDLKRLGFQQSLCD